MWIIRRLFLIFVVIFAVVSAEFCDKINRTWSKDNKKQGEIAETSPKLLNKRMEGLTYSNLIPAPEPFLQNVDTVSIFQSKATYVIPIASNNSQITQQCREDSWLYAESLKNFADWALKMFDASGKIPSGTSSGNHHYVGHFDQCLKVRYTQEHNYSPKFTGKYCPVYLFPKVISERQSAEPKFQSTFNSTSSMKSVSKRHQDYVKFLGRITAFPALDFCLPSSCSASDVETGVYDLISSIGGHGIGTIKVAPYTVEDFCTAADSKRSFDATTATAMWVFVLLALILVLGTAYDAFLRLKGPSSKAELQTSQRILLSFSVLTNGAQVLATRNSAEGNIACVNGIRFLSGTWVILNHTWKFQDGGTTCFMSTIFTRPAECMPHSWYLAVDMQMFCVSPLFIYALWRWRKAGVILVGGSIVGFTAITVIIVATNDMPATSIRFVILYRNDPKWAYYQHYYIVPWCRIMPYLVDILMGYVFHNVRHRTVTIKPCTVFTGWLTAAATALAVVYGLSGYYGSSDVPVFPKSVSVLYASLHRTAWALALSWLIFACVQGYGGIVNKFLSWPIFLPLSRLMYSTYLIHPEFIKMNSGYMRTVPYYTPFNTMLQCLVNFVVSLSLAFITAVCVEVPFLHLEKLLFSYGKNVSTKLAIITKHMGNGNKNI